MARVFSFFNDATDAYAAKVAAELQKQPLNREEMLTPDDTGHLPRNVQKYISLCGAVGKPKVQNMRLEFEAEMWRKPGSEPMICGVVQYSFFGSYARIFFLKTNMFRIPARVLHAYIDGNATMQVRIASLFDMVHITGPELTRTETVTVLNDLCAFAPSAMTDKRLSWLEIDALHTAVTLRNGQFAVTALLHFNEKGELVNFESDDRPDVTAKPGRQQFKWSTPLRNYRETGAGLFASEGDAVYHYPEGNFVYGTFKLRKIEYNVITLY